MPDLSEADLKFVLSCDPDEESLNQAISQINSDIDSAQVKKIKMGLEQQMLGPPEALPISWLEKKFGKVGSVVDSLIGRSRFGEVYKGLTGGGKEGGGDKSSSGIMGAVIGGAEGGGAGAALGAAAGGDMAVAYEGVKLLAEGAGQLAAAPFKMINAGLSGIGTALQGMQGPLGPIGAGLDLASAALQGVSDGVKQIPIVGEIFGPLLDAFAAIPGAISKIAAATVKMVAAASPAVIVHFNQALDDAMATIGEALIPLFETLTDVINKTSDVMANIMEVMKPVIDDIGSIFVELGNIFKELAPVFEMLVIPLKMISTVALGIAKALSFLADVVGRLPKLLLVLMGLGDLADGTKTRTTAARNPTLGGIQEYQQRLQLQTAAGPAGGMDITSNVSNIASNVAQMNRTLESIEKNGRNGDSEPSDVRDSIDRAERK